MIAVELFTASGGLAAGFRAAGIEFELAIDRDADACDSYETNLGVRPVQLDVHDLLRLVRSGWLPAPAIDLLVADPPCTPWSRAGKRQGLADERDVLEETVELIRLLRPACYLIGNIPGLQDAPHWPVVQRTIGSLAHEGYCVRDFAVLDAADYGVPQRRERPFWFGHLRGPCLRWPAPTHCDPARAAHALPGLELKPWVTCREALQHLPLQELGRPVRMKLRPAKRAERRGDLKHGSDVGRCSTPDAVASTLTTKDTAKGGQILVTEPRSPNGGDASMCSTPDRPAATVVAHQTAKGGQILAIGEPRVRTRDDRAPRVPQSQRHTFGGTHFQLGCCMAAPFLQAVQAHGTPGPRDGRTNGRLHRRSREGRRRSVRCLPRPSPGAGRCKRRN